MTNKITYIKCSHCKGTGKVRKTKDVRIKCKDCQDFNHGCFGSGSRSGLGARMVC